MRARLCFLALLIPSAVAAQAFDPATAPPGTGFIDCEGCPVMVVIPAGDYLMGGKQKVSFKRRFAVSRTEITFAQWDACVAEKVCNRRPDDKGWGRGELPVMNVTWDDTRQYLAFLKRKTRRDYRLLSEAEWEYVARAGTTTDYYWGDSDAAICEFELVEKGGNACGKGRPLPVGQRRPNAFGLYDMLGSMIEWVEDCWNEDLKGVPADGAARKQGTCSRRVLRGGAWNFLPPNARVHARGSYLSLARDSNLGFRVARDL